MMHSQNGAGTVEPKMKALSEAGAIVISSPVQIGQSIAGFVPLSGSCHALPLAAQ